MKSISRTSHEVRGLKCENSKYFQGGGESHLTRGAWIEMEISFICLLYVWSHLTRGAWIEISGSAHRKISERSHLTRGAWIEI